MLYIYSHIKSNGARDLVQGLNTAGVNALRLRKFDGMDFWRKSRRVVLTPEDAIICWGTQIPKLDGIRVLNSGEYSSKFQDARDLINQGVPTVQIGGFPQAGFIGRKNNHVGGSDLLSPPNRPDFYVKKVEIANEFRIHSFCGRSMRAGKKILREGWQAATGETPFGNPNVAHPWIRSYDSGWRIFYDNFKSTKTMRALAHKAVKALKLDFGAVDIAQLPNGDLIVLEVNKAPGLEGGTIEAYVNNMKRWYEKVDVEEEGEDQPATPAPEVAEPPAQPLSVNGRGEIVVGRNRDLNAQMFYAEVPALNLEPAPADEPLTPPDFDRIIREARNRAARPPVTRPNSVRPRPVNPARPRIQW